MTKPTKIAITGHRLSTLTTALGVAAERYDENAKMFRKAHEDSKGAEPAPAEDNGDGTITLVVHPRIYLPMAEKFEQQAKDTRELLALLMDGPEGEESEFDGEIDISITYTPED